MPINIAARTRIILDLLKDGIVANEAPYAGLDRAPIAVVAKYASAVWKVYPGQAMDPANPTNDEAMENLLRHIRRHFAGIMETTRVPQVRDTAGESERVAVKVEVENDLGADS